MPGGAFVDGLSVQDPPPFAEAVKVPRKRSVGFRYFAEDPAGFHWLRMYV